MRDVFAINHHIMKILIEICRENGKKKNGGEKGEKTKDRERKKQIAGGRYKPSHIDKHIDYKWSKHSN